MRKSVLRCGLSLLLLVAPRFAVSQKPDKDSICEVDVCQVLNDPSAFDGLMLRFRGRLEFEFEGFNVNDDICALALFHTRIAWTYGGDPLLVSKPEAKHILSLTSPVLKDAQFDEFGRRARARRVRRSDGEKCHSHRECAYYDVIVTYTGRFFAGKMRPGRTVAGGFGHFGCCHLFVIEQVSEVEARRTSVPDEEREFFCASTSWQAEYPVLSVSNIDARLAANKQFLIDQVRLHDDDSLIETMESASPWDFLGLTGYLVLSSPDLLTTYTAQFPQSPHPKKVKKHQSPAPAAPIIMTVSRERCEAAD